MEHDLPGHPRPANPTRDEWIRELRARFLSGQYRAAIEAAVNVEPAYDTWSSAVAESDYHFYSSLARAACFDTASDSERQRLIDEIVAGYHRLQGMANASLQESAGRAAIVSAEISRIEGRIVYAEHLYERAAVITQQNGSVFDEAVATELTSRFYKARGLGNMARLAMQDARDKYRRCGADAKVRQLEATYPFLGGETPTGEAQDPDATTTEQLDLAAVIKVSQAASRDIVFERLVAMIAHAAIEQTGADRAVLVLSVDGKHRVLAQATSHDGTTQLDLREIPANAHLVPELLLDHALQSPESVVLEDRVSASAFAGDPYFRQHGSLSVLCLPVSNLTGRFGALYLEGKPSSDCFTAPRVALLKLLASQASISLENARLYQALAEREARIRRLVDANIIGIVVWNPDDILLEANDAFLRMVGYTREDLASGNLRWTNLMLPEWEAVTYKALAETEETGRARPFEKEYKTKDGGRVPVIVGLAMFEGRRDEGIAFVLDLTERKRAEEDARRSERRHRELETELAHANRVATIGQLAASIVHEVKQPVAATVMNAEVGQRWLKLQNMDEIRQVFERIASDGHRAVSVINRIRDLIKKAPPSRECVDVNLVVQEVLKLTEYEISRHNAVVRVQLSDDLPQVNADRIELQQVILNLVVNALEAMTGVRDREHILRVTTKRTDDGLVLVAIHDSGPGFDIQSAAQAFTPFFTTKSTGLGMGLSICRSIIDAHGGQLWISMGTPTGAIMQFTLPPYSTVQREDSREDLRPGPADRHPPVPKQCDRQMQPIPDRQITTASVRKWLREASRGLR